MGVESRQAGEVMPGSGLRQMPRGGSAPSLTVITSGVV